MRLAESKREGLLALRVLVQQIAQSCSRLIGCRDGQEHESILLTNCIQRGRQCFARMGLFYQPVQERHRLLYTSLAQKRAYTRVLFLYRQMYCYWAEKPILKDKPEEKRRERRRARHEEYFNSALCRRIDRDICPCLYWLHDTCNGG